MSGARDAAQESPAPRLLTRDAIVAAQDLPSELVEVPEWGGSVRVRGMTGAQRDAWEAEFIGARAQGASVPPDWRVRRVAMCLVDEDGKRLFPDREVATLGGKSGLVIDRIDDVVVRLSGLREATPERPSSEDEAVTELGKGGSVASGSA